MESLCRWGAPAIGCMRNQPCKPVYWLAGAVCIGWGRAEVASRAHRGSEFYSKPNWACLNSASEKGASLLHRNIQYGTYGYSQTAQALNKSSDSSWAQAPAVKWEITSTAKILSAWINYGVLHLKMICILFIKSHFSSFKLKKMSTQNALFLVWNSLISSLKSRLNFFS